MPAYRRGFPFNSSSRGATSGVPGTATGSIATDEYFDLYRRYIEARHRDGDMYPPVREQYESFLSDEWGVTEYYRVELPGQLAGVAVVGV